MSAYFVVEAGLDNLDTGLGNLDTGLDNLDIVDKVDAVDIVVAMSFDHNLDTVDLVPFADFGALFVHHCMNGGIATVVSV